MAFGLATYLRAARWPRASVRRALLVFAAASPAAAGATFGALATAPALSSPAGIALCVLFSGGTFLYASCIHILARAAALRPHPRRAERAAPLLVALLRWPTAAVTRLSAGVAPRHPVCRPHPQKASLEAHARGVCAMPVAFTESHRAYAYVHSL